MKRIVAIFLFHLIFGVESSGTGWNWFSKNKATFQVSVQEMFADDIYRHAATGCVVTLRWIATGSEILRKPTTVNELFVLGGVKEITINDSEEKKRLTDEGHIKSVRKFHVLDSVYHNSKKSKIALLELTEPFDSAVAHTIPLPSDRSKDLVHKTVHLYSWKRKNQYVCFGKMEQRLDRTSTNTEPNKDNPATPTAWASPKTNSKGTIVVYKKQLAGILGQESSDRASTYLDIMEIRKHTELIHDRIPELNENVRDERAIEKDVRESTFQAAVYGKIDNEDPVLICMGTIIGLKWILTRASILHGINPNKLEAAAGSTASNIRESTTQRRDCRQVHTLPEYRSYYPDERSLYRLYDFALVELKFPFEGTFNVKTVNISRDTSDWSRSNVSLYSWPERNNEWIGSYHRLVQSNYAAEKVSIKVENETRQLIRISVPHEIPDHDASITREDELVGIVGWEEIVDDDQRAVVLIEMSTFLNEIGAIMNRRSRSPTPINQPPSQLTVPREQGAGLKTSNSGSLQSILLHP